MDTNDLLPSIFFDALDRVFKEVNESAVEPGKNPLTLERVRKAWLRSLREAFARHYKLDGNPQRIAVYGGRPKSGEIIQRGVPTGLPQWAPRWELLYDVAVLQIDWIEAAYAPGAHVPLVNKAIWHVESEIAGNGTAVAEDASKLRMGRADNVLLIAKQTTQINQSKWLEFLGKVVQGVEGNLFLALMPSYAGRTAGAKHWISKKVEVDLYKCASGGGIPQLFSSIGWPAST